MKRTLNVFMSTLLCVSLSGCFNTDLVAPVNRNVTLLTLDQPTSYHDEYRNWYLLGGLIPIWTTQPEEIIEKENLTEVRVNVEDTISDGVIVFLTGMLFIGIFPQTVVIEGNPGPIATTVQP